MADEYDEMGREELLYRVKDWRQLANERSVEINLLTLQVAGRDDMIETMREIGLAMQKEIRLWRAVGDQARELLARETGSGYWSEAHTGLSAALSEAVEAEVPIEWVANVE